ncbi:transcriptional repressor ILP1 isoform X1 [Corylus avellana]|uniref:transcriptional repressor ILP1 isoform X1 n=1 Tax=Corylus avellana TaxID=13451 RepID=UPI00286BAD1A|nr:transcriptional repressor ILP1 isoform X1 [Corylus avellana]
MSSIRARNFRRRAGDDDDDNNNQNDDVKVNTKTTTPAPKPKPKKLLSFADDEDALTPSRSTSSSSKRPTKLSTSSSSSHKVTSRTDRRAHSSASVASNVQPQAGTYTKEALLQLQKNTRTLAPSRPSSTEPAIVLKGLLKPPDDDDDQPAISQTLKQNDGESEDDDHNEEHNRERLDAQARFVSLGIGKPKDSLIPDQATIEAIRAKRERLRKSRAAAPDYISLDGGSNHGEAEGLSDEEPEFRSRIAMFGEKKKTESTETKKTKKGVFEDDDGDERATSVHLAKDSENGEEDKDEEEKIWEEEQFRKGLGKRMDDGTSRVAVTATVPVVHSLQQHNSVYPASVPSAVGAASIGGAIGASQGLDALMSIPQQAEVARKALQESVRRLKESHGSTIMSLAKTDDDLSASLSNITALEKSLSDANEKFIFMQKLRHYVSVICDFLKDKAPYIEELEEQMQKLHEERASAILERRAADNDDELMEVEAAVSAAMSVFSQRGSSAEMIAAARSAAQAASATVREQTNLPVMLDEFGRDINLQKRMDMTRRAERRKARFNSKRISSMELDSSNQRIEGESSSDESDSESTAYQHHRKLLLQTADQIFSDAAEEYSQLSAVKERFEKWKRDYSSSYRDAYMSLSVPAIFSPYVRLELLKWDPLHEDVDFFDMKWHSVLFNYGLPTDGSDFASEDTDANLVPELVEKVALPILHHEIVHCWDMLSTRETKNAVNATGLVTSYVPASNEALSDLLAAIRTCLAEAVANLTVPTWSPLVLKAVPGAARVAAYRFGMSVRLLRNICLWKDIFALPVIEKLALDELLCGKLLPHVRSITANVHDAITRTERIIAALFGVWAGPNVTGGRSHRLQPLVDYVLLLGKTLEKKRVMGITESETSGLARRLKKLLVELNEYDNARELAKTFHLKEAL